MTLLRYFFVVFLLVSFSAGWSCTVPRQCLAEDYRIAPADVLEISIWGEQELARRLVVRPDGKVSFPLIGDIQVAGKTTSEIKSLVEEKIREYIPEASATVIVSELGSLQYYVIGKVRQPGMFNVSRPLTVLQALALAGGLTTFADEDGISVVRHTKDGEKRFPFDYSAIKKGEKMEQNIELERGDVVVVP